MRDVDYMRIALRLAERGRLTASPNPMVGAVAVRHGEIAGMGYHPGPGQSHAEVFALEGLSSEKTELSLYVTLEPCNRAGRTPPCVKIIVERGVGRVVCAMEDPDEGVSGGGIQALREAGVKVEVGVLEVDARRLNEAYVKHRTSGLPFVTLKLATSLDGRIAATSGDSKWISSEASRVRSHRLRAEADAVLVGSGTLMADDPALTVRHVTGPDPLKIVLDSKLQVLPTARILQEQRLVVAGVEGAEKGRIEKLEQSGVEVWLFPPDERGQPSLREVLRRAASCGVMSVVIEGGGEVAASAIREGLADRVAFFAAPKLIGIGVPAIGDLGVDRISDSVRLTEVSAEPIGENDVLYTARVTGREAGRV